MYLKIIPPIFLLYIIFCIHCQLHCSSPLRARAIFSSIVNAWPQMHGFQVKGKKRLNPS